MVEEGRYKERKKTGIDERLVREREEKKNRLKTEEGEGRDGRRKERYELAK